jgi:S1-C subfamily serine protease
MRLAMRQSGAGPTPAIMRFLVLALPLVLTGLAGSATAAPGPDQPPAPAPSLKAAVVRLNSTVQQWSPAQPWEKTSPTSRRALAAIVGPAQVVSTAEMVADATYLEFESPDGSRFAPAKVLAVDYEANLALLGPADAAAGAEFFAGTRPAEVTAPARIGDPLTIYQIDDSGVEIRTTGTLQGVSLDSGFLPQQAFLTYHVKASMQSAASSYSLPVFRGDKVAGVLFGYNSKDQMCDVSAPEVLRRFLQAAARPPYQGTPSLGVAVATTEDPAFRQWLKLGDDQGGLYLSKVRKGSAAARAGLLKGDVLLAIDGLAIDRRGYFQDPAYGSLSWGHLVRGEKAVGDVVTLALLREGKPLEVKVALTREEERDKLVPGYTFGLAPAYLVKGGMIFQELTVPLLESFGQNWASQAPLNLLEVYQDPDRFRNGSRRIVFLSGVIPTPATVGYDGLRNLIVHQVNGRPVRDIESLAAAFAAHDQPRHAIRFDQDDFTIYLDEALATAVDGELRQRGIPKLQRLNDTP